MTFSKKSLTDCDPKTRHRRNQTMMMQNATGVRDIQPVVLRRMPVQKSRHETGEKAFDVNGMDTSKRMEWVAQLAAVRDHKDQRAFAELFRHFAPRVKAFLMKSGSTPEFAEECAQEVMATLWRKADMFDGTKASVSTWIFTIARNRRIDMIRKTRRPEPEDLPWGPEAEPEQSDVLVLQQESEQLGAALAALPEKQRVLIEKAYFGELSHSEIADATGLPLGTIKSRIRLALDRLRHAMG
jgi:RNA polymerase sigma-70 factor (ECF subfamily)